MSVRTVTMWLACVLLTLQAAPAATPSLTGPPPEPTKARPIAGHAPKAILDASAAKGGIVPPPPPTLNAPPISTSIESLNFDSEAALSGLYHIPPDPIGAAGPNHLVAVVNTSIWWATKAGTGVTAQALENFFAPLSAVSGEVFDPKVMYDQYADRFVVVVLEQQDTSAGGPANTSRILVAVSDDSDPNGTWRFHAINSNVNISSTNYWADYPGLAVDDEAVYITNNMFTYGATRSFGGSRLWIVNKTPFYSGGAASVTIHDPSGAVGQSATTTMPAHTFGAVPGATGTWLMRYSGFSDGTNESLSIIRVDNPITSPTFAHTFISLGNIDNTAASLPAATQLGTATTIDSGDRRMLHAVWRNDALYGVSTVRPPSGADATQATTHWFKINTGTMTLSDQGDVGGEDIQTGAHTYWASIAVNASDSVAIGFALSGSSTYAGAYYVTRFASDAAGTVSSTAVMAPGLAPYVRTFGGTRNRWGDYSGMSVDPADGATFWQFHEYAMTQGTAFGGEDGRWATRFGSFSLGPAVTLTSAAPDPTNTSPIPVTATFSESVTGFVSGDITPGNATVSGFTPVSGSVYTFNLAPVAQGAVTADIAANVAQNGGAVGNQASAQFVRTFDTVAPTISIGAPSTTLTNTGPVTYTITYGGADSVTLATGNVTLNTTGTANGTVSVSGSGTATRTVTISSVTGNGTLGISIAAGTASDNASNTAPAASPSATFAVDNIAPTIAIGAPSSSVTRSGPVSYTITYGGAAAVTLSSANVSLNTTGSATGSVAVTGSGTASRTVTLSSVTGDGTIGISIAAGTATDGVNLAPGAGPSTTFSVDNTGPGIAIGTPSPTSTRTFPISFPVTYTGAASVSLVPANITLNSTGTATGTIGVAGGGVSSRTVTISSVSGDGTLGISIAAGTALDSLGNPAPATGPSTTATVDNTPPTISIGAPSAVVTSTGPVTYTVTYGGASSVTLSAANITLNTTGTATGTIAVFGSGTTERTVQISSISGDGTLGISIGSGTATDALGNTSGPAGPSTTFTVDSTAISVGIGAPSVSVTRSGPVDFEVNYGNVQTVTLAPGDITLNRVGTANGTVSVSGAKVDGPATRTVTISGITGDGSIGISIAAGTATDTASFPAPAAGPSITFDVDNTPPGVSIGAPTPSVTDSGPVSFVVSYLNASSVTLAPGNVTVNATGTAAVGGVNVTGSGAGSRTVTLNGVTGDGSLTISIAPGTATDAVGNTAGAAGPSPHATVISGLASLPVYAWPLVPAIAATFCGLIWWRRRQTAIHRL